MYPLIPSEAMTGAAEMLCYFCTVIAATLSFMLARSA